MGAVDGVRRRDGQVRRQRKLLCEGRRRIERQGAEGAPGKINLLLKRRDRHRSRLLRL